MRTPPLCKTNCCWVDSGNCTNLQEEVCGASPGCHLRVQGLHQGRPSRFVLISVHPTALGPRFTAVLRIAVEITVTGDAAHHPASAGKTRTLAVRSSASDAARAAILGIVGEHRLAGVGGVAVTVGSPARTILQPRRALGSDCSRLRARGGGAFSRGIGRRASRTAPQSKKKTEREQRCAPSDTDGRFLSRSACALAHSGGSSHDHGSDSRTALFKAAGFDADVARSFAPQSLRTRLS